MLMCNMNHQKESFVCIISHMFLIMENFVFRSIVYSLHYMETLGNFILAAAATAAKLLQSCLTLCDPIDGSPPGSPIPGILQERTLEWVAISFSNAWKWKGKVKSLSRARLLVTPWTAGYQAPPSVGFSRQEYWSGVPLPSPLSWLNCFINKETHHHRIKEITWFDWGPHNILLLHWSTGLTKADVNQCNIQI